MNDIEQLKHLLLGDQKQAIADINARMVTRTQLDEAMSLNFIESLSKLTPEQLQKFLQEPMLDVLTKSSRNRNKDRLSSALSPVMMPTIRQSIAQGMRAMSASIDLMGQHLFTIRGLRWRKEAKQRGVPFAQVVMDNMIEYRVESAYVVQKKSGLMVARMSNTAVDEAGADTGTLDRQVMARIQTYLAGSSDNAKLPIKKINLDQKQLWFIDDNDAMLACVIRGAAPDSVQVAMTKTLATIHQKYSQELASYEGLVAGSAIQMTLEPLVAQEAVKQSKKAAVSPVTILLGGLGLLLLSLLAANLYGRWQQYNLEQTLQKQPSLLVTRVEQKGWWFKDFVVRGVYDPMFPPKAAMLAESSQIDAKDLRLDLTPYLSLDPSLSLQRAQGALSPPVGVKLGISPENKILVSGIGTQVWKDRSTLIAQQLPYVSGINFDGFQVNQTNDLQPLVTSIESRVLAFSKGAVLADGQDGAIIEQAEAINKLQALAAQANMAVSIKLFGFTSGQGADDKNAILRQERAEAVKAKLEAAGVNASLMQVLPTSDTMLNASPIGNAIDKPLRVQTVVQLDKK